MDVTHPARWLHSGSAPVHPPILEYHQGTWHGIHLIVHSPHSPSRTRTKTNKQGRKHLFAPTQRCPPCRTSTGLWWKKSQTSTRELASNSSCVCHCFTKFPTSTFFFCQRLSLRPVATCSFISSSPLDFLQTLHIYCSHASHIVSSASDSSGGSPGFNHGECSSCVLTSIRGRFFQLAGIHVCRDDMSPASCVWQLSDQLLHCSAFLFVCVLNSVLLFVSGGECDRM